MHVLDNMICLRTELALFFYLCLSMHNLHEWKTSLLYFKGQKIWEAIISDLLPKGLIHAEKALLSGCSAGALASFLHCDSFTLHLPRTTTVKCLSDAGFFLDV